MPHPKGGYFLSGSERVPGVTTILSRFKESGGLIYLLRQAYDIDKRLQERVK